MWVLSRCLLSRAVLLPVLRLELLEPHGQTGDVRCSQLVSKNVRQVVDYLAFLRALRRERTQRSVTFAGQGCKAPEDG